MLKRLNDFLRLTAPQHRGMIILTAILLLLLLWIYCLDPDRSTPLGLTTISTHTDDTAVEHRDSLFVFDPSSADSATFAALGFDGRQIRTILKFRQTLGGKFEDKSQFARCYAVSDSIFRVLEPYIEIEKPLQTPKSVFDIDINRISLAKLKTHKAIDLRMAEKIFRARIRYGGFVSVDQMLDVFKNDSLMIRNLEKSLVIDTAAIVRYQVNIDAVDMLSEHPYITRPFAEAIVRERESGGEIYSIEELKNLKYFPKSKEKYLRYYIEF